MADISKLSVDDIEYDIKDETARTSISDLSDRLQALIDTVATLGSGGAVRVTEVTLLAENWVGEASPYSQVVSIDGVTERSKVDLSPSVEQLVVFHNKDLAFVAENEGGVVTVYAIGQKPENDYTIQATVREVDEG